MWLNSIFNQFWNSELYAYDYCGHKITALFELSISNDITKLSTEQQEWIKNEMKVQSSKIDSENNKIDRSYLGQILEPLLPEMLWKKLRAFVKLPLQLRDNSEQNPDP